MLLKGITEEDFTNYKKPSMYIAFPYCTFKCEKECGIKGICQNSPLALAKNIEVSVDYIIDHYINNPITHSIVCAGLEPLDSFDDMFLLLKQLRQYSDDDFVIYTGYYKNEILTQIEELKKYKNVIIKYGRFKPNQKSHFDEVLGISLVNNEQYAEKIS